MYVHRRNMAKELTKLQIIEIRRELEDRVMEMIERYEKKYGLSVFYNFTVDKVKIKDKTK